MRHSYDIMIIYMEKYKEKNKEGAEKKERVKAQTYVISNENLLMATASLLSIFKNITINPLNGI